MNELSKITINNKLTGDVLSSIDRQMYGIMRSANRPMNEEQLENIYIGMIRYEVSPESRPTLNLEMMKKHFLGYLREVDPNVYNRCMELFSEKIVTPPQETIKKAVNTQPSKIDGDYTDFIRKSISDMLNFEKPKNFQQLVDIYDNFINQLNPSCIVNINFVPVMHDIMNYAQDNFNGSMDYNIFYLENDDIISKQGYNILRQFKKDIDAAYNNNGAWFYQYVCPDCGQTIYMKRGEANYYIQKSLQPPKRCKECRIRRKTRIESERREKSAK